MKKFLFLIISILILASCEYENPPLALGAEENGISESNVIEPPTDSIYVNAAELQRLLNSGSNPVTPSSRSGAFQIDTVHGSDGMPLIYIINYGRNGGFLMLSALKTAFPILAYNTVGHYDVANISPNARFGLENIATNVKNSLSLPNDSAQTHRAIWRAFENTPAISSRYDEMIDEYDTWPDDVKELYHKAVFVMRDTMGRWTNKEYTSLETIDRGWPESLPWDEFYRTAEGNCYPMFMCRYKLLSALLRTSTMLYSNESKWNKNITWDQKPGFNQSYPFVSGKQAPAGCGPVAAGQIMRYHEWPATFNWSDMPYNQATKTTSDFLLQIAEAANASYGSQETGVTGDNINSAFKKFGYKTSGVKNLESIDPLSNSASTPVLILGWGISTDNRSVGHAFVACGYSSSAWRQEVRLYTITRPDRFECVGRYETDYGYAKNVYINWGYYGSGDGYFNFNYLHVYGIHYNKNLKYIIATPNK